MTEGTPRVIRVERLPRQWSLMFVFMWSLVASVPGLAMATWMLTPMCGVGYCFEIDGLYEYAPLYLVRCAWWIHLVPMAVLAALPLAVLSVMAAWRALRGRLWRPRRVVPELSERLGDAAPGTAVRVRGRVRAPDGFTSRTGRRGAVIASYLTSRRAGDGGRRPQSVVPFRVLEATDFQLVLAGGEEVRVFVSGMTGLEAPTPTRSLLFGELCCSQPLAGMGVVTHAESLVVDGDAVEVVGVVGRVVDPGGAGGYRGERLIPSLGSEGGLTLSVQPLEEPFFAPDSHRAPAFTGGPASAMPRG